MDKAEKRALERFPVYKGASKEWTESHLKCICGDYIEGYHQAEKDLELTWKDMEQILDIINNLFDENFNVDDFGVPANKEFYQEVLKRFKERKVE